MNRGTTMGDSALAAGTDQPPGVGARADAWLARLESPDCSAQERAMFEDWLAQSPRHIDAYLQAEQAHALSAALADDPLLRAAARKARRDGAGIGARRWLPALGWAAAAGVAVTVGALFWRTPPAVAPAEQYATAIGEQRTVVLSDRTTIRLDTNSAVTARFDARGRTVEVVRGRVQFEVGRDPERPFLVVAGPGRVRDIGTTFQVSRLDGLVNVALIDGAVEVTTGSGADQRGDVLAPGEQVAITAAGGWQPKRGFDVAVARSWTSGELVFKRRRLDALLDEMNRYSVTPVRLDDPALGAIEVSGVFHAGDQDALLAALERGWPLRARRQGSEVVLTTSGR